MNGVGGACGGGFFEQNAKSLTGQDRRKGLVQVCKTFIPGSIRAAPPPTTGSRPGQNAVSRPGYTLPQLRLEVFAWLGACAMTATERRYTGIITTWSHALDRGSMPDRAREVRFSGFDGLRAW